MKQRLIHIDIAKAIGLIIIMTSHINVHPSLREMTSMKLYQDIIHSFYVPLFFILSGIFLKPHNTNYSLLMDFVFLTY